MISTGCANNGAKVLVMTNEKLCKKLLNYIKTITLITQFWANTGNTTDGKIRMEDYYDIPYLESDKA